MPSTPPTPTLLDEIDRRQNAVLEELDQLNQRVEALLIQHVAENQPGEEGARD